MKTLDKITNTVKKNVVKAALITTIGATALAGSGCVEIGKGLIDYTAGSIGGTLDFPTQRHIKTMPKVTENIHYDAKTATYYRIYHGGRVGSCKDIRGLY